MKYLVKQRMPNFIEHNQADMEHLEMDSLEDIQKFEFMTFQRLQGNTKIMFIAAEDDQYTPMDFHALAYSEGDFGQRTWVANVYILEDD